MKWGGGGRVSVTNIGSREKSGTPLRPEGSVEGEREGSDRGERAYRASEQGRSRGGDLLSS